VYMHKGRLITVEFKIHDWRRAIRQARDHRLAADLAYVCMPKRQLTSALREDLRKNGVGLFFFCQDPRWPFELVVEAPHSRDTWTFANSALRTYVLTHKGRWA